ncbi:MAG TPA: hypothetical protein VLJ15_08790 [Gammaproteobacteria bacterium]|nr:hypothetical protein [Gammaproteobacteria bacterium]
MFEPNTLHAELALDMQKDITELDKLPRLGQYLYAATGIKLLGERAEITKDSKDIPACIEKAKELIADKLKAMSPEELKEYIQEQRAALTSYSERLGLQKADSKTLIFIEEISIKATSDTLQLAEAALQQKTKPEEKQIASETAAPAIAETVAEEQKTTPSTLVEITKEEMSKTIRGEYTSLDIYTLVTKGRKIIGEIKTLDPELLKNLNEKISLLFANAMLAYSNPEENFVLEMSYLETFVNHDLPFIQQDEAKKINKVRGAAKYMLAKTRKAISDNKEFELDLLDEKKWENILDELYSLDPTIEVSMVTWREIVGKLNAINNALDEGNISNALQAIIELEIFRTKTIPFIIAQLKKGKNSMHENNPANEQKTVPQNENPDAAAELEQQKQTYADLVEEGNALLNEFSEITKSKYYLMAIRTDFIETCKKAKEALDNPEKIPLKTRLAMMANLYSFCKISLPNGIKFEKDASKNSVLILEKSIQQNADETSIPDHKRPGYKKRKLGEFTYLDTRMKETVSLERQKQAYASLVKEGTALCDELDTTRLSIDPNYRDDDPDFDDDRNKFIKQCNDTKEALDDPKKFSFEDCKTRIKLLKLEIERIKGCINLAIIYDAQNTKDTRRLEAQIQKQTDLNNKLFLTRFLTKIRMVKYAELCGENGKNSLIYKNLRKHYSFILINLKYDEKLELEKFEHFNEFLDGRIKETKRLKEEAKTEADANTLEKQKTAQMIDSIRHPAVGWSLDNEAHADEYAMRLAITNIASAKESKTVDAVKKTSVAKVPVSALPEDFFKSVEVIGKRSTQAPAKNLDSLKKELEGMPPQPASASDTQTLASGPDKIAAAIAKIDPQELRESTDYVRKTLEEVSSFPEPEVVATVVLHAPVISDDVIDVRTKDHEIEDLDPIAGLFGLNIPKSEMEAEVKKLDMRYAQNLRDYFSQLDPNAKHLDLSNKHLDDVDNATLKDTCSKTPASVTSVDLRRNGFVNALMKLVCILQAFNFNDRKLNLTSVNLSDNLMASYTANSFSNSRQAERRDDDREALKFIFNQLAKMPNLITLDLSKNHLADYPKFPKRLQALGSNLKTLDLSHNGFSFDNIKDLLPGLPRLTRLIVKGHGFETPSFENKIKLLFDAAPNLQSIQVSDNVTFTRSGQRAVNSVEEQKPVTLQPVYTTYEGNNDPWSDEDYYDNGQFYVPKTQDRPKNGRHSNPSSPDSNPSSPAGFRKVCLTESTTRPGFSSTRVKLYDVEEQKTHTPVAPTASSLTTQQDTCQPKEKTRRIMNPALLKTIQASEYPLARQLSTSKQDEVPLTQEVALSAEEQKETSNLLKAHIMMQYKLGIDAITATTYSDDKIKKQALSDLKMLKDQAFESITQSITEGETSAIYSLEGLVRNLTKSAPPVPETRRPAPRNTASGGGLFGGRLLGGVLSALEAFRGPEASEAARDRSPATNRRPGDNRRQSALPTHRSGKYHPTGR